VEQEKLEWAKAFAPVAVALTFGAITAYIAWRQYRVSRSKLSLDLFERRYNIFSRIWTICVDAVGAQKILLFDAYMGAKTPFDEFWPQASFLFGAEINDFIQQTIENWLTLSSLEHQAKKDPMILEGEERRRLFYWFQDYAGPKMKSLFDPYLDFSNIR
jgi:hypothetical protein